MNIDKLSINPYPEWQKKEVFLKILVEGKGTLYVTPQQVAINSHPTWTVMLSKVSFVVSVKVIE